jgi:outer membrane protein OmpA-like peptidoglycan-associated protein
MKKECAIFLVGIALAACQTPGGQRNAGSGSSTEKASANSPLAPSFKTFPIYTDLAPRHTHYAPSGYMGDSDLSMSGAYVPTPRGQGPCLRVIYKADGPKGWAGIYWQDPANNWGDVPGRAGFDLRGATKLTFWARGDNGGERVHEFRVGGIVGQYPDSDVSTLGSVRLSKDWKPFTIDLKKKDLRHIIGGFGFFVNKAENPGGMVFYLTDIIFEGPGNASANAAIVPSTSTIVETPVTPPAPPTPTPPQAPKSTKDLQVKEVAQGLQVSFSSQFLFSTGRAVLQPGSSKVLNQLIGLLSAYPANPVLIEGHTDSTGNAGFNLKLSELRASAVRDYLIKQGGFDEARFKVVGYGDTRPIGDNTTKAGRSLNRRVEVTILKTHESQ